MAQTEGCLGMTDRYIFGRYANGACDLMHELRAQGISARVGYHQRNRQNTLVVLVDRPDDLEKVSKQWRDFDVVAELEPRANSKPTT